MDGIEFREQDHALLLIGVGARDDCHTALGCAQRLLGAHTLRIVYGGLFKRYPKVKMLLGHMGETLPYLLWRLDARAKAFGGEDIKPAEILRRNVAITTAGMFSNEPLNCAVQSMGEDSVIFSVDHPFESMAAAASWFDKAPVSEQVREKISSGTAARILKL
jgi:2,3-dihydroxybenzoate decarboxylase